MKKKKIKDKRAAKLRELRKSTDTHAALVITQAVEKEFARAGFDDVWKRIDAYRAIHKDKWFIRCFLPYEEVEEALDIDSHGIDGKIEVDVTDIALMVDEYLKVTKDGRDREQLIEAILHENIGEAKELLPIVGAWRQHKEIFTFDTDFLSDLLLDGEEIYTAGSNQIITPQELASLPFPAFYVDATFDNSVGFFFCYNSLKGHEGSDQLLFYFINPELQDNLKDIANTPNVLQNILRRRITFDIHDEEPDMSVWDCYERDCLISGYDGLTAEEKEYRVRREKEDFVLLFHALQIITYLASQFADVQENPKQKRVYKRTTDIQDKPTEIRKWDVGVRMGTVLKTIKIQEQKEKAKQAVVDQEVEGKVGEGKQGPRRSSSKKPHSRRAHWQYYWYGKKDGSEVRYRRLRFKEATLVNVKNTTLEEIPATYHPVITF